MYSASDSKYQCKCKYAACTSNISASEKIRLFKPSYGSNKFNHDHIEGFPDHGGADDIEEDVYFTFCSIHML